MRPPRPWSHPRLLSQALTILFRHCLATPGERGLFSTAEQIAFEAKLGLQHIDTSARALTHVDLYKLQRTSLDAILVQYPRPARRPPSDPTGTAAATGAASLTSRHVCADLVETAKQLMPSDFAGEFALKVTQLLDQSHAPEEAEAAPRRAERKTVHASPPGVRAVVQGATIGRLSPSKAARTDEPVRNKAASAFFRASGDAGLRSRVDNLASEVAGMRDSIDGIETLLRALLQAKMVAEGPAGAAAQPENGKANPWEKMMGWLDPAQRGGGQQQAHPGASVTACAGSTAGEQPVANLSAQLGELASEVQRIAGTQDAMASHLGIPRQRV